MVLSWPLLGKRSRNDWWLYFRVYAGFLFRSSNGLGGIGVTLLKEVCHCRVGL